MPAAAAARGAGPSANFAPLVAALAPVAFAVATWFELPGAVCTLIVLVAAALLSTPPTSAPTAARTKLEPEDPALVRKQLRHRAWSTMRWRLFIPNADWSPLEPRSLRAGWRSAVRVSTLIAVGAALVSFSLPTFGTEALIPLEELRGSSAWWPYVQAVAAYSICMCLGAFMRRTSDARDPRPAVSLAAIAEAAKQVRRPVFVSYVVAGILAALAGTAVILAVRLMPAAADFIVHGNVIALGAALLVGGATLRAAALPHAYVHWRGMIAGREMWGGVWPSIRIVPEPTLRDRRTITVNRGSGQSVVIIDELDVPASLGATGLIQMRDKIAPFIDPDGASQVALLTVPAQGRDGSAVPGSQHPTRVRVAIWPADLEFDLADAQLWRDGEGDDADLIRLRLEMGVAAALEGQPPAALRTIEVASDAQSQRAAYATTWNLDNVPGPARGMIEAAGAMAGVQARFDEEPPSGEPDGILYVGDLAGAEWPDESIPERFEQLDIDAEWSQRWYNVLKQGQQRPWRQHEFYAELELGSGQTVHVQPFMQPQGIEATLYISAAMEERLPSTLDNAPWVATIGWPSPNGAPGERWPGAFRVLWSHDSIPLDPALVPPDTHTGAASLVLAASINRAFDAARLARPEVVSAKALTKRDSSQHVWDIVLRLYGGVTLAAMKKAAEQLRLGLGATAWLRIADHPSGARIVVGGRPSDPSVTFARQAGRDLTTALDWGQAFGDSRVVNLNGQVPELVSSGVLEKNPKVQVLEFRMPPGLSIGIVREARTKLMPATGNVFLDVRSGTLGADTFRVLASAQEPLPFPAPIDWAAAAASKGIVFAAGVEGEPVEWDWTEAPHLLALGGTRSGKSITMTDLVAMVLMRGCEVYLADPVKFAADFMFARPWLRGVATTVAGTSAMMDTIYAEVMRRKELNGRHGAPSYLDLPEDLRYPHMVVFIDEFTSLIQISNPARPGSNASEAAEIAYLEMLADVNHRRNIGTRAGQIAREAGSAGVSLVIAGQQLKADDLNAAGAGGIKTNMASLLIGKVGPGSRASALKEPQNAPDLGEEIPKGRAIFETPSRMAYIVQTWYDGERHTESLAEHIAAVRAPLPESEQADFETLAAAVAGPGAPVHGRRIVEDDLSQPDGSDYVAAQEPVVDLGVVDLGLDQFDFGSTAVPAAAVSPAGAAAGQPANLDSSPGGNSADESAGRDMSPFGEPTVVAGSLNDLLALIPDADLPPPQRAPEPLPSGTAPTRASQPAAGNDLFDEPAPRAARGAEDLFE